MRRSETHPHAPWLAAITVGYVVWSLGPLILAIVYSFNAGSSITHWKGFSLRWWVGDPAAQESILYDHATRSALEHSLWLATLTTAIAVPVGTAFAMGCPGQHYAGRLDRADKEIAEALDARHGAARLRHAEVSGNDSPGPRSV